MSIEKKICPKIECKYKPKEHVSQKKKLKRFEVTWRKGIDVDNRGLE